VLEVVDVVVVGGAEVVVAVVFVVVVVLVLVVVVVDVIVAVVLLQDAKTSDVIMRQVNAIQTVPFFIHTSFSLRPCGKLTIVFFLKYSSKFSVAAADNGRVKN
jgi:hypothetical protein